jgi:hypothetical protein
MEINPDDSDPERGYVDPEGEVLGGTASSLG